MASRAKFRILLRDISHPIGCECRPDDEPIFGGNSHYMDRIDVFLLRWDLQLAESCGDARNGNLLFPAALVVSPNCIAQRSFKEIDHHAKSRYPGRRNVAHSIA